MEHKTDRFGDDKEVRRLAEQIANERIAPDASERDLNHTFPWDAIRILAEAGILGVAVSEDYGGFGGGRVSFASVVQEISKACASTALVLVSHAIAAKAIELAADKAVAKRWLPEMVKGQSLGAFAVHEPDSGSNAGAITTRAMKDGNHYIVNGSKFFITSAGEANLYLVLVKTDPEKGPQGMSTILVEKDTPGLSFGRSEDKMGMTSTSSREMFFSDCRIPIGNLIGKEGEGTQVIGKAVVGWGFFGAAAISVGIADSAVTLSVKHAKERTIAGHPIGIHQAVQFLIADIILGKEAAESLLVTCAARADSAPDTAAINGFKAKLFASETAVDVYQSDTGHGRSWVLSRLRG
ncbi:MAG: acyl-CoA dehydrogenase family protein [Desulfobacterales bacterium]|uniref:Acyl-CoA dehydrogenase family protein n=1 Tax=Candidatus Desulfatibia profunda TaxID=2841695 RepID=A0A8J6NR25_9BACT|nr:acyl-CoA dehydrogenase family protein [Candidatus Desulfatibia profunda]MBL7178603.1 acyl-CoA dehydrogenase family protein [Desulfobacterales bacterium]